VTAEDAVQRNLAMAAKYLEVLRDEGLW